MRLTTQLKQCRGNCRGKWQLVTLMWIQIRISFKKKHIAFFGHSLCIAESAHRLARGENVMIMPQRCMPMMWNKENKQWLDILWCGHWFKASPERIFQSMQSPFSVWDWPSFRLWACNTASYIWHRPVVSRVTGFCLSNFPKTSMQSPFHTGAQPSFPNFKSCNTKSFKHVFDWESLSWEDT